ncbi:SufD family Fe-S cluster assembly protein [Candidatus Wolfebacteria bacterium]|nr:SufD family Fe-S cluster assembly protein [Candidatus Wolfebacteria bacterium]
MNDEKRILKLAEINKQDGSAKIVISGNDILSEESDDGIILKTFKKNGSVFVNLEIPQGVKFSKPIHICLGALYGKIKQRINFTVVFNKYSKASIFSHCLLVSENEITHNSNYKIKLEQGAECFYFEKHIHNNSGNLTFNPSIKVEVGKDALFKSYFELLKGRAGNSHLNYDLLCAERGVVKMESRFKTSGEDFISLTESVALKGKNSRALLKSRVAAKEKSSIEIYNNVKAIGDYSKGHIDCQEILLNKGRVKAYPCIEVLNPKSKITHEASLGGIDNKKMETLMARGNSSKKAEEIILEGLLSEYRPN